MGFVLLGCTFHYPSANWISFKSHFQVISVLAVLELTGLSDEAESTPVDRQFPGRVWLASAGTSAGSGSAFTDQDLNYVGKMFTSIIPIHKLMAGIKMFADQTLDPAGWLHLQGQAGFRMHPKALAGFVLELPAKSIRAT